MSLYDRTLIPRDCAWARLSQGTRDNFIQAFFLVTWACLLLGFSNILFWEAAIAITALQVLLMLPAVNFRLLVFPVQLRIVYAAYLAAGTYVPELVVMMYITTLGLAARLAVGYCPLARMMYLLPWNRRENFSPRLLIRTFVQAPRRGRFELSGSCAELPENQASPI